MDWSIAQSGNHRTGFACAIRHSSLRPHPVPTPFHPARPAGHAHSPHASRRQLHQTFCAPRCVARIAPFDASRGKNHGTMRSDASLHGPAPFEPLAGAPRLLVGIRVLRARSILGKDAAIFKVPSSKFQVLSSARRRRGANRQSACEVVGGRCTGLNLELGTRNLELGTRNSTNHPIACGGCRGGGRARVAAARR